MLSAISQVFTFIFRFMMSRIAGWYEDREGRLRDYVLQHAEDGDPDSVLKTIDTFCWDKRWMMHLGDEKRAHLEKVLKEAGPIKTALELGLYCGYSATTISRLLAPGGQLFTVEPVPKHRAVASAVLAKAGLADRVTIVPGKACEVMDDLVSKGVVFDFVFIDHHKSYYLSDLKLLEDKGLMHEDTIVFADNVIIFKSAEYLDHVRGSGRYKSSTLHMAHVEYSKSLLDGVEVSVYGGQKSSDATS